MSDIVIGFDLDMTLIDTRAGIAATHRALAARTGVHVDADAAVARLGPPLREELARWFPADQIEDAVETFRSLYPTYAYEPSRLLPGVREALTEVRRLGGRIVVLTSKLGRLARGHLDHFGIAVDDVVGDRFGPGKADAITAYGIGVYVGDHVADMTAARTAGARAVAVATGPCAPAELAAAGAEVVLSDLGGFPGWLRGPGAITGTPATAPRVAR